MNLYIRLLLVWLRNLTHPKRHYSHASESGFRVMLHDLDAFGHMNNGRYLQIMDVARTEWMLQTGVLDVIRKQRWAPLLGGGVVRYRHSLRLFQHYHVRTRLLGWDHRWFYTEHCFFDRRDRCVAVGVTRAGLRNGSAWVHADEVVNQVHPGASSPEIPAHVRDWIELDNAMYRHGEERVVREIDPATESGVA